MTRIEDKKNQVEELEGEVDKLKKRLKRKRNKKLLSCSSCLVFAFLVFLILSFFAAYVLAKSGLKDIYFLTDKFYQKPEPSYLVEIIELPEEQKDILSFLKAELVKKASNQQKLADFKVNLELSDAQLTAIIRDKIQQNQDLNKKIDYIQLAVLPDNLELFLKTKEPKDLFITLDVLPVFENGEINLEIINFKLGDLQLPKFIGNITFAYFTEKGLNNILSLLERYGRIEKINLYQGLLSVEILISDYKSLFYP